MIERLHRLLTSEADALVAAGNFTIVILLVILGVALAHQLLTRTFRSDLKIILVGLLMEAIGWSLHRLYYGTTRFLREQGYEMDQYLFGAYVPMVPVCIIIMGLVLMLTPIWKQVLKIECHPCWAIMGSWALYWLVFLGVKLV